MRVKWPFPQPPHFKKRGRLLSQPPKDRRPCADGWRPTRVAHVSVQRQQSSRHLPSAKSWTTAQLHDTDDDPFPATKLSPQLYALWRATAIATGNNACKSRQSGKWKNIIIFPSRVWNGRSIGMVQGHNSQGSRLKAKAKHFTSKAKVRTIPCIYLLYFKNP